MVLIVFIEIVLKLLMTNEFIFEDQFEVTAKIFLFGWNCSYTSGKEHVIQ